MLCVRITKIRANALTTSVAQGSKLKTSIKNGSKSKKTLSETQRRKVQISSLIVIEKEVTNLMRILLPIRVC